MVAGHRATSHQIRKEAYVETITVRSTQRSPCRIHVDNSYADNGFCARGEFCRYSHGEDAVVPGQLFQMNSPAMGGVAMPFMPMFPGGGMPFGMGTGAGAAYDPHEARMDMRPQQERRMARAPIMPRIPQENGHLLQNVPGELPVIQDLTPELPPDARMPQDAQNATEGAQRSNGFIPTDGMDRMVSQHTHFMNGPVDVEMSPPTGGHPMINGQRNVRGGRPARGRGAFGDAHSFRPERRNDKTLVVEKIPDDKINLLALNEWFKKFGTVTNVAIDAKNKKALVSFSEHSEAHAAWKSEDAVFNNRFVKLFWHRPMEGHGQTGARMLAASAPLVANIVAKDSTSTSRSAASPPPSTAPTLVAPSSVPAKKPSTPSATATALATKQQLLERQIAEQKSLMSSLATASADEKKQIMARLRKLVEEMKPSPSPTPTNSSASPDLPNNTRMESTPQANDHERKIKERLDKELELHSATVAVQGGTEEKETTEDLKARLAKLKAEVGCYNRETFILRFTKYSNIQAASLGLPEVSPQPVYGASRPYRGRGRAGRSYHRGAMRGGPPRGSMTLDNRPKKLLVKGVGEDGLQAVRDWYEVTSEFILIREK
jgi:RNA-binding protein 26